MSDMSLNRGLILALAVAALPCFVIIRGLYNAFLHPLAKVPGPKLYALTDIPYLYHLVRGEWPHVQRKLHDQYGPILRYAPHGVSVITAEGWKKIYGHKNNSAKTFAKDRLSYGPTLSGHSNIIIADDEGHKRMRRLLSHAFSETALRKQEGVMKPYIDLFISHMTEKARRKEVIDMVQWFNFTTFDLIGDLAFGEPFGCLEKGVYHPWVSMIFESMHFITVGEVLRRYPFLKALAAFLIPMKLKKSEQEHWELSEKTALRRLDSLNTEREDFMSYILRHNDEKGMTRGEVVENSSILIIAGSETTATQLSGTTFNLLSNPDAYRKVTSEIRAAFASEDEITMTSVNDLQYMLAVFDESFRIYPPVPIGLPRTVCEGGESIEGLYLPQGTTVSVPQWPAYRSESNWHEPNKFIPERWLGDGRFDNDNKEVLQPFTVGPRNCIGRNLAYAEMRLILARLLWRFDLEIMPESRDWNEQKIWTLWDKKKLYVKLTEAKKP